MIGLVRADARVRLLASARLIWHTQNMSSISVPHKKRGRPATGHSPRIGVRFADDLKERIEQYAETQNVSVSEAIRQLVEAGLSSEAK